VEGTTKRRGAIGVLPIREFDDRGTKFAGLRDIPAPKNRTKKNKKKGEKRRTEQIEPCTP